MQETRSETGRRRARWGIGASALALALIGLPSAALAIGHPSNANANAKANGVAAIRLAPAGTAVQQLGMTKLARVFAGDAISPNGQSIIIYTTNLDRATEQAFRAAAGKTVSVHFEQVPKSLAQISAIQDQTTADFESLKASGILLDQTYPDNVTGRLVIGVVGLTSSQSATLNSKYGASNIELVNEPPSTRILDASRNYDSAAWNGGDNITDCPPTGGSGCGDCTSGFGVTNGTDHYLLTASHCYSQNETIYNGFSLNSTCDETDGSGCGNMGTVTDVEGGNMGTDVEMFKVPGGSTDLVWTGQVGHAVRAAIYDHAGGSTINDYVCNEGAYTTEECGIQIDDKGGSGNNLCVSFENGVYDFCHLVEAKATSSTQYDIASGVGDSGGPVIWANNGTWYGVGTVTAHGGTLKSCHDNTSYITVDPTHACGTTLYYTSLSTSLSALGVSLNPN